MEIERLLKELRYREERLPYDEREVKRSVECVQETFDFCKRRYDEAVAERQACGDALPVPGKLKKYSPGIRVCDFTYPHKMHLPHPPPHPGCNSPMGATES